MESSIVRNQDGSTSYSMVLKMSTDVNQDAIFSFLEQNSNVIAFQQTIST